ncbi:hypothetical protein [Psychrosphaera haliotis]|uniref:HEAT repeat domain-containing protein n=1 Tax=Psychrosphaera haliotis TaxID=555083 RepID=A0A6N8FE73_9GAMM|nr:hypothetical protein [Psychrosphaera haliotis]MUH72972.1 hypothetical protein [Psychrosphaera haliotis]
MNDFMRTPDSSEIIRQPKIELDSETKNHLLSLTSANNSSMRSLAVRNLQFYPEHLDVLLALIKTESEEVVINEVRNSLLALHKIDSMKDVIEHELQKLADKYSDDADITRFCGELLNNINN